MKQKITRSISKKPKKSPINWYSLISWILLCESAGIIGSLFTMSSIPTWYVGLVKPSFSPPNWIFGPVWITLYALMGIAAYRISHLGLRKPAVRNAVFLFLAHLLINTIWSIIFFGGQNIPLGFANIGALWVMIIILTLKFDALDSVSAYLMLPYLAWVSFATVLNYSLWLLNP